MAKGILWLPYEIAHSIHCFLPGQWVLVAVSRGFELCFDFRLGAH